LSKVVVWIWKLIDVLVMKLEFIENFTMRIYQNQSGEISKDGGKT